MRVSVCLKQGCRSVLENALSASRGAVVDLSIWKPERLRRAFLLIYERMAEGMIRSSGRRGGEVTTMMTRYMGGQNSEEARRDSIDDGRYDPCRNRQIQVV